MTKRLVLSELPGASANSKPHDYKQEVQKMKGPPKTWVLTWKQFEDFRQKKYICSLDQTNLQKKTEANLKKALRLKLLQLCKTRTKKSFPDLVNIYVALAGHDMITDAGRATTCRQKFRPHDYKTKVQKSKDFPKMSFTEKLFEFLKKGCFPNEKQFWHILSRIAEYDRPQV